MIDRKEIHQPSSQVVDINDWQVHSGFEVYPVGARDKSLRICPPDNESYPFCIKGHRYLFKEAIKSTSDPTQPKYPDQYWSEIIAFKIARLMNISVPPAFAAINSSTGAPGALIEWFNGYPGQQLERYAPGGDYMQKLIDGYDREKGKKHNLKVISIFATYLSLTHELTENWKEYWGLCLCFDALIGNTDRHQENWGTLWSENGSRGQIRFTPYFDNGTSLGHEQSESRFTKMLKDDSMMQGYLRRGTHQMREDTCSPKKLPFVHGVTLFASKHEEIIDTLIDSLSWNESSLYEDLMSLVKFKIKSPLTQARADFIYTLSLKRRDNLMNALTAIRK